MSRLDGTAGAFVDGNQVIKPARFVFLDFDGDPLRACDAGYDIVVSGQADADLNGTFFGLPAEVTSISPITVSEGGTQSVSCTLSGIKGLDDDVLAIIGDESKWKGRTAKVWRIIWDQNNAAHGAWELIYTGYMVDVTFGGSVDDQTIELVLESYLAVFFQPSNRTYLNSRDFDPGDASGELAVAVGNGSNAQGGLSPGGMGSSIADHMVIQRY